MTTPEAPKTSGLLQPSFNLNLDNVNNPTDFPTFGLDTKNEDVQGVLSPVQLPEDDQGLFSKSMEFLFGLEGAVVGIAHDQEGWSWSMDNLKQQWSEEPLWVNLLGVGSIVGTLVFPAWKAAQQSAKFGALATKTGRFGGEAAEIAKWKAANRIDPHIVSFAQLGDDTTSAASVVKKLRQQDDALTRYATMSKRVERGTAGEIELMKEPMEWMKFQFQRRFANSFFKIADNSAAGTNARRELAERLDSLWSTPAVVKMVGMIPSETSGAKVYAHLAGKLDPELATRATKEFGKLTPDETKFVEFYSDASRNIQAQMLDEGLITKAEYDLMGEFHLPALNKDTLVPGLDQTRSYLVPTEAALKGADETYKPVSLQIMPRLDSPTLKTRKKTHAQAFEKLGKDQLLDTPYDIATHGFLTDSMLLTNYRTIVDIVTQPERFGVKMAQKFVDEGAPGLQVVSAQTVAEAGWDAKRLAKLGLVRLDDAGPDVAKRLQAMISKRTGKEIEDLPYVSKEIFDDIFGEAGMMNQTRGAINFMEVLTTIHKTAKTAGNPFTHLQNIAGTTAFGMQAGFNILDPRNIKLMNSVQKQFDILAEANRISVRGGHRAADEAALKSVTFEAMEVGGRKFSAKEVREELASPVFRDLVEMSAFQQVEGAGNLTRLATATKETQHATRGFINLVLKGKRLAQMGDRVKWWDKATEMYLAEDIIPKMGYYWKLRGQGLSQVGAATEVARRYPMYNTVGSSIAHGRKYLFPWATFPAEALRITKNNMMDHPLRMIPWLRAPQIMQTMLSGMGVGPETAGEVEAAKEQLPFWAQKDTTLITEGGKGAAVGGAGTGAFVGFLTGALKGGGTGAAVGTAVGAGLGYLGATLAMDKEHEKGLRGAVMDWLPHSTFMLPIRGKGFGTHYLPWKDMQGMLEQMPAEPLTILRPFVDIAAGRTAYGEPLKGDYMDATVAGVIGMLAPPLIQKYGFRVPVPDVGIGPINVSRGLVDTGNAVDPNTGLPGSFNHDFFLNNFSIWKSYAASGAQQLANEGQTERHLGELRNVMSRNLAYHLENANDKEVVQVLSEIQGTFSQQYLHDPRLAQQKYTDWLERNQKKIGRHPKLRNWSEEELTSRLRLAGQAASEMRGQARDELLKALKDEMRVRNMGQSNKRATGFRKSGFRGSGF